MMLCIIDWWLAWLADDDDDNDDDDHDRTHNLISIICIIRIFIQRHDLSDIDDKLVEGTLTLVDLAGSEHKIDSM